MGFNKLLDSSYLLNWNFGSYFPESPTNPDVVKSSIDYFTEASRKLGQRTTVITCDQAIYDIAKALILKHKGLYRTVILRLGGFLIAENFFKVIGFSSVAVVLKSSW